MAGNTDKSSVTTQVGFSIGCCFTRDFCYASAVADLQMRVEIYQSVFFYPELRYGKPKQPFFVIFLMRFEKKKTSLKVAPKLPGRRDPCQIPTLHIHLQIILLQE